jgi:hypothetical protein
MAKKKIDKLTKLSFLLGIMPFPLLWTTLFSFAILDLKRFIFVEQNNAKVGIHFSHRWSS